MASKSSKAILSMEKGIKDELEKYQIGQKGTVPFVAVCER